MPLLPGFALLSYRLPVQRTLLTLPSSVFHRTQHDILHRCRQPRLLAAVNGLLSQQSCAKAIARGAVLSQRSKHRAPARSRYCYARALMAALRLGSAGLRSREADQPFTRQTAPRFCINQGRQRPLPCGSTPTTRVAMPYVGSHRHVPSGRYPD